MGLDDYSGIEYLCLGHCCHDQVGENYILGGTASYAAAISRNLGIKPAVLTSVGSDFQYAGWFRERNIPFISKIAEKTTVFRNIYKGDKRIQYLLARAEDLGTEDVPDFLNEVPILHLCPIADEIDFDVINKFRGSLIGASIQGCLRQWDQSGLVSPRSMIWNRLKHVHIAIISDEDIAGHEIFLAKMIKYADQVVLTMGSEGAKIFSKGQEYFYPSFPTDQVETTGAGDVFTTAYLIEYLRSSDIRSSCIFAHCAASFVVEGTGLDNLPGLQVIRNRVEEYCRIFNLPFPL